MIYKVDQETKGLFQSLIGRVLNKVSMWQHPGMGCYSLIGLEFDNGNLLYVKLKEVDLPSGGEAFIVSCKIDRAVDYDGHSCDRVVLEGFRIDQLFLIRRREGIAHVNPGDLSLVGRPLNIQGLVGPNHNELLYEYFVDCGVVLISDDRKVIRMESDGFPLVMRFAFSNTKDSIVMEGDLKALF